MYVPQYSSACGPLSGAVSGGLRQKWPFQSAQPSRRPAAGQNDASTQHAAGAMGSRQAGAKPVSADAAPSIKAMAVDIALVLAWGAMIPGLMWLGHAGGF